MRERNNPFTRNGTRSELKSIFGIFFDNADKTTFFFPRVNSLISNFDRDTITYENLNRTDDEFSLYKFSLKFKKIVLRYMKIKTSSEKRCLLENERSIISKKIYDSIFNIGVIDAMLSAIRCTM